MEDGSMHISRLEGRSQYNKCISTYYTGILPLGPRRRDAGSATECSVAGEKNGVGYNQSLRRVTRARGKEGLARPPVSMQLAPRHYNRPPLSAFVHIGCPS